MWLDGTVVIYHMCVPALECQLHQKSKTDMEDQGN